MPKRTILVTGGAGFIGSALVRHLIGHTEHCVVNADLLTYAGNLTSLEAVIDDPRHHFERIDICDAGEVARLFKTYRPESVMHLAAETHVDRSIDEPASFVGSNVVGTFTLLEAAHNYFQGLSAELQSRFRFLHISTDEVFGSLGQEGHFCEDTPYDPRSPYSASKAASDHFVRAYYHTYGLPTLITNCSNNYGPFQHPEKLIPTLLLRALAGEAIPIYGRGDNVRDWLFVEDHVRSLLTVLERGTPGESYAIGASNERSSLEMAQRLCALLDEFRPGARDYSERITFVEDRPGHDFRYAIDASKLRRELGWTPEETFESGLRKTVEWYLGNPDWVAGVLSGRGLERLGTRAQT